MTTELLDRIYRQNHSNRLDGDHSWCEMVNLLDAATSIEDEQYVARRMKRAGFESLAEVKHEMRRAILRQMSELSDILLEIEKAEKSLKSI